MDLFSVKHVKLTAIQKDSSEGEMKEEELLGAGKTPGLDGKPFLIYSKH
jgi:hypothetical protein